MTSLLILLLSFSDLSLSSPPSLACDRLSDLSCAAGSYSDGTGSVPSERELIQRRDQSQAEGRAFLESKFREALANPDNLYFREIAKNAMGLTAYPQCSSTVPADIASCNANLLEGLVTLGETVSMGSTSSRLGDLESVQALVRNNVFSSITGELQDKIDKQYPIHPTSKRIQTKIFPQVKDLLVKQLEEFTMPQAQKDLIISKLKSVTFDGADCAGESDNPTDDLFFPNAFYNPQSNTFKYCSGMILKASSEFTIASIIAHELSHSIDPCRVSMGLGRSQPLGAQNGATQAEVDNQSPYRDLITCLRDPASIGARSTLPPQVRAASLCEDQIGESFCDWMAAQVLPGYISKNHPNLTRDQYINGYANAYRPICRTTVNPSAPPSLHPLTIDRVDKIILTNPQVRAHMGCPTEHGSFRYCPPNAPPAGTDERLEAQPQGEVEQ